MKVLVWEFPDGSVALRELWESMRLPGESDADFAERIRAKTETPRMTPKDGAEALDAAAYKARMATLPNGGYGTFAGVVEKDSIPKDRSFRNAWKLAGGIVEHDMAKCREMTKERLRAERAPLLADQDVAFQRALESNSSTSAIVAEKQRLRDVTKLVKDSMTLDELKALKV